jgi:hypothetical protein
MGPRGLGAGPTCIFLFFFFILPSQECQTLGEGLFFYLAYSFGSCQITRFAKKNLANSWRCWPLFSLPILIWELTKTMFWGTKYGILLEMLNLPQQEYSNWYEENHNKHVNQ